MCIFADINFRGFSRKITDLIKDYINSWSVILSTQLEVIFIVRKWISIK